MKKIKLSIFALGILLLMGQSAFALTCSPSREAQGSTDQCWASVTVASNETTLVSAGTVLNFDITNAQFNEKNGSFQVRVTDASADGVTIAGVAQNSIASGATALVLVRGRGDVALKTTEAFASGSALWVSTSGDASGVVSSTTQTQLGFSLETTTASGNTRTTKKAYITIV